jgi:hypothetical protein
LSGGCCAKYTHATEHHNPPEMHVSTLIYHPEATVKRKTPSKRGFWFLRLLRPQPRAEGTADERESTRTDVLGKSKTLQIQVRLFCARCVLSPSSAIPLAGCGKLPNFSKNLSCRWQPVDARHKAGHDDYNMFQKLTSWPGSSRPSTL